MAGHSIRLSYHYSFLFIVKTEDKKKFQVLVLSLLKPFLTWNKLTSVKQDAFTMVKCKTYSFLWCHHKTFSAITVILLVRWDLNDSLPNSSSLVVSAGMYIIHRLTGKEIWQTHKYKDREERIQYLDAVARQKRKEIQYINRNKKIRQ